MVRCISRWLKRKTWILVGDGAYACMALAKVCMNSGATLISRLRLDAQLPDTFQSLLEEITAVNYILLLIL